MNDTRTPAEERIEAQVERIHELESTLRLVISFLLQYSDAARSTTVAAQIVLKEQLPDLIPEEETDATL
jgi:hypothetical protein